VKFCNSVAAIVVMAFAGAPPIPAADRTPPDVVARASRYVDEYVVQFANFVAEEHYVQALSNPRLHRDLVSDFLLVSVPNGGGRYLFRDVIEVDGKPVGDHGERLTKLFLEEPAEALARAKDINEASERYNLVHMGPTDQPLFAIALLQSIYVSRFQFTPGRVDKQGGATVHVVRFDERQRPTIIKGPSGGDFVLQGRFWIDESTVRVLRTELDMNRTFNPPRVVTTFKFDDTLQIMVPAEMRTPIGVATYGGFRRFTVKTEEKIR
jgi:hypothetical protein